MSSHQLDEEAIFHVAREISNPDARMQYLAQVCGGDQALQDRVAALLAVHEQEQNFLKSGSALPGTEDRTPLTERPGMTIGRYKLMEQIGEGGMGVVFVTEQERPLRRKVALKVIKPGMDSKAVIARFEAERQALAMMDHPNIAKVLDAGSTESGKPYFVMELVRGIPITEYCDHKKLTIHERLILFARVCQAVQHAHQRAIIHRDIKPGNILVTEQDGEAVPKVIDFGIAKALNQSLADRTIYTSFRALVGTPLYMSPEQATLSAVDVDTRSDVYSLGVLLYELIVGATPFDRKRFSDVALDEACRIVREEDIPSIGRRLSALPDETTTAVCALRRTDVRQFQRHIRGDLENIVAKTLAKDRNRRYDSPKSLVEDIQRFLDNKPVTAVPDSFAYRFQKYVRRNRAALIPIALTVVTILAISAGLWQTRGKREAMTELKALVMQEVLNDSLLGDFPKARRKLDESRELNIENVWRQKMNGQIYLLEGRYQKAISSLLEAESEQPGDTAINAMLVLAYDRNGDEEAALRRLGTLQQTQNLKTFSDHLFRGWALSNYLPRQALIDLAEARRQQPLSHMAMLKYAEALRCHAEHLLEPLEGLKAAERAIVLLTALEEYLTDNQIVLSELVRSYMIASDRRRELDDDTQSEIYDEIAADKVRKLTGLSEDVLQTRAYFFRRSGQGHMVVSDFRATESSQSINNAHAALTAIIHFGAGDYATAEDTLSKTDMHFQLGEGRFALGFIKSQLISETRVLKWYQESIDRSPGIASSPYRALDWSVFRLLGCDESAREMSETIIDAKDELPVDAWVRTLAEHYLKGLGSPEEMLASCGNRWELVGMHFCLAIDYLAVGERSLAEKHFTKAVETNNFRAYLHWWSEAFLRRMRDDSDWPNQPEH